MRLILVLSAFLVLVPATHSAAAPAQPEDSVQLAETLLQCMQKCIQYEGGNSAANKETCKSRCAGSVGTGSGAQRDCGTEYKACNRSCGKQKGKMKKECLNACRAQRRSCF